jgi:hypothetical protein
MWLDWRNGDLAGMLTTQTRERRWAAACAAAAVLIALSLAPAARAADPVIAAAGNVACDPASPYYNAGAGMATRCRQKDTSDLLPGGAAAVLALGDNQYGTGALSAYTASYDPTWGRLKGVTRPVPGDRDYGTSGAAGYFDYFNGRGAGTGPAGDRGRGYYSFDLGAWHLVALNSNCSRVACGAGSAQETWLRADLAAHQTSCTLAYLHASRFSSGRPGSSISVGPLYRAMYQAGVDVVLSGHARHYERFAPQTHVGRPNANYGLRQFVVGTGGHSLGQIVTPRRNSEVRENTTFGVLEMVLGPTSYSWRFAAPAGATFSDSGGGTCHPAPPKRRPKPPAKPKPKRKSRCTILGTPGNDVLRGTQKADVICGLGGHDRLAGNGGNDLIRGGDGNDRIAGGPGRDRLLGNRGRDVLRGGSGPDVIHGGAGNDVLRGQSGADRLFGQGGRNRVFGNSGNDFIESSLNGRRDRVDGGRGRDRARVQRRDSVRNVERLRRTG